MKVCDAVVCDLSNVISCHFCHLWPFRESDRCITLTDSDYIREIYSLRETALSFLCFLDHISGLWPNLENSSWRSPRLATQSALYFFPVERNERETDECAGSEIHKMDHLYIFWSWALQSYAKSIKQMMRETQRGEFTNSLCHCVNCHSS